MNGYTCILEDGQRVQFSLKRRQRDPYHLVIFRGPEGRLSERSTKERGQRGAVEVAVQIIKAEYRPNTTISNPSWEEAIRELVEAQEANNLREPTIYNYQVTISTLRNCFPLAYGPAEITPQMAKQYKANRLKVGLSPFTVRGDLTALNVVFGKWWCRVAKLLTSNPFAEVERPKAEKAPPRIVSEEERQAFFDWLRRRWENWRLPILFLEVKSLVGCRISELAATKTVCLRSGRLHFVAQTTKGRKERAVKLPPEVFAEMQQMAGKTYVFERFSAERREIFRRRGLMRHVVTIKSFSPAILKNWLEVQLNLYFKKNPELKRFKIHNFRGTAMSRARQAGVSYDDASVAFGCHPETMRKHYVTLNETSISDQVMDAIQKPVRSAIPEQGTTTPDSQSGEI